jgi:hypothetical protein
MDWYKESGRPHDDAARYLRCAAVELDRRRLHMEGSVDNFMGRLELHLDLAGIGVYDEGLTVRECGRSDDDSEG